MNTKLLILGSLLSFNLSLWSQSDSIVKANKQCDSLLEKLLVLNAYNFDFNEQLKSNYVGLISYEKNKIFGSNFGINVGIMTINYSKPQEDSLISGFRTIENVWVSPFGEVASNSKYLRQLNEYKYSEKISSKSLFAQPKYILNATHNCELSLHVHTELLITKVTGTLQRKLILEDTLVFNEGNNGVIRSNIYGDEQSYNRSLHQGYFGIGTTLNCNSKSGISLFLQPTFGVVVKSVEDPLSYGSFKITSNSIFDNQKFINCFYLVKARLGQEIKGKSTLFIGAEIRGQFPNIRPIYAVYTGLSISLSELF